MAESIEYWREIHRTNEIKRLEREANAFPKPNLSKKTKKRLKKERKREEKLKLESRKKYREYCKSPEHQSFLRKISDPSLSRSEREKLISRPANVNIISAKKYRRKYGKMSILISDFTAEGHKLGLSDATKGYKPNKKGIRYHWKMFKKGFRIRNRNEAIKTFRKGYETGFANGLQKREDSLGSKKENKLIKKKTNSKKTKSNPENLKKQIELLNSFDNFLSNIQSNLNEVNATYGKLINELYESGLVSEYANKVKEDNRESFQSQIAKVNQWIDENDKKYAKQVQAQVKDAI